MVEIGLEEFKHLPATTTPGIHQARLDLCTVMQMEADFAELEHEPSQAVGIQEKGRDCEIACMHDVLTQAFSIDTLPAI